MTTIELNNKNQTKINFSYEHDLPYKKSIRPDMAYGDWNTNPSKLLLKVNLSDRDYSLFKNPNNIKGLGTYVIGKEIWIDLEDAYLIIDYDKKIEKKVKENNLIIAFLYKNKLISSIGS